MEIIKILLNVPEDQEGKINNFKVSHFIRFYALMKETKSKKAVKKLPKNEEVNSSTLLLST